jgi:hypothetical protein
MNQGSKPDAVWIASVDRPWRNGLGNGQDALGGRQVERGEDGDSSIRDNVVAFFGFYPFGIITSFSPVRPVSIDRSAFCSDSWNVRPIAITSPTDFI